MKTISVPTFPLHLTVTAIAVALAVFSPMRASGADEHDHDHSEEAEHDESHQPHDEHDEDDEDGHADRTSLSELDMADFGIHLEEAGPGLIREELRLPGEIRMNENAVAHVAPRFSGVATDIQRRLGAKVKTGEVLAVMETNDTLRPFELKAPIDGTIVDFHLTLGESLEAGNYAFVVADTSTVWADLNVYQRDLRKVREGQRVLISAGHGYDPTEGTVSYLGPVVNESTRTGLARVVLENPNGDYRPGLFVIGNVVLDESEFPVVVPLTALQSVDGKTIIYTEAEGGEGFEAREVIVGHRDTRHADIKRGLEAGEHYVAVGGFFLKADAQKEDFGDGHAH